ncbi:MAG: YfiR family protein [Candidatus Zixiibacteriota bacterium]
MKKYLPFFFIFLLIAGGISAQEVSEKVNSNKARVVINIINNTEWPAGSNAEFDTFTISVIGQPAFVEKLKQLSTQELKSIKNVAIRTVSAEDDLSGSSMVIVSENDLSVLANVLKKVENKPILTVSDIEGFARYGIIAELAPAGDGSGQIEYLINKMVLRKSGLKISEDIINKAKKTYGK